MARFNQVSDTKLSTCVRGVSRFGTLCGVTAILAFAAGCQPCFNFDAGDNDPCTVDTCEVVDNTATAVHTPVDCGDQVCNPADGECVDCLNDADCAQGLCSEAGGNVCVECLLDSQCAAGQVCTSGQCVAEAGCTGDGDCAAGEVCTNSECVAEAGCAVDADCAAGQVCTNGACVAGGTGGDAAAGEAFYTANGCAGCHGADASGGFGPNIQSASAAEIFARLSGATAHTGGTVEGVTEQDAQDLEAWLSSL